MKIKLLLFAAAKEIVGANQLVIELSDGDNVAALKAAVNKKHPAIADLVARSAFSVDQKYASDETLIEDSSEVAMIPPVSGG